MKYQARERERENYLLNYFSSRVFKREKVLKYQIDIFFQVQLVHLSI